MYKRSIGKGTGANFLYSFGWNNHGQLGHGDLEDVHTPKEVTTFSKRPISQVAAGWNDSVALQENGDPYSWGNGMDGQLGHGDTLNLVLPCRTTSLKGKKIVQIATGGFHSVFVKGEGKKGMSLWTCGLGLNGRLGHGSAEESLATPKKIPGFTHSIIDIACGSDHSAVVTEDGQLFTWGCGKDGRLGHGKPVDVLEPTVCEALRGRKVKGVTCGSDFTVCLLENSDVVSFGAGQNGRLGFGDTKPQLIPKVIEGLSGKGVKQVSCGSDHAMALCAGGTIYSWGYGANGRTGHNSDYDQLLPKKVEALAGCHVVLIACGGHHSCALLDNHDVLSWGWNFYGQLGYEGVDEQKVPKSIPKLMGKTIKHIECGEGHSLVLSKD